MAKATKIKYEDFDLVKFKLGPDTPFAHWYDKSNNTLGKQTADLKEKLHEDLFNALESLKLYFATRLGLLEVTDELRETLKGNREALEELMKKHEEQIERCTISGITISGLNQLKKIQITGKVSVPVTGSFSLACPGINLASDLLGYEEDVMDLFEVVRKEVFQALFNGKKAPKAQDNQTDLIDQIEQEEINDMKVVS